MKPVLDVLAGGVPATMPLWLMRQAGRYLPEYRALRLKAGSFLGLALDPALAAEVTLQPVLRFGMDAAILFSDILMIPYGLGQALDYREGEGPVLEAIRTEADLQNLDLGRVTERLTPIAETVRMVHAGMPRDCTLIGFAGGAWTVAAYMIEGHGGGEFQAAKVMAYQDTALFDRLIALIEDATFTYLSMQIDAGAEVVQIFDSWAGILDSDLFGRYVTQPTKRLAGRLKARNPAIPIIGFPRMCGLNYGLYARGAGVDALALDTTVPLSFTHDDIALPTQGNLDPELLLIGGSALENGVRRIVRETAGKPHIFNLGHGVSQHTDPDSVQRLVQTLREAA
jgi:uroporphyrinogen decarboxylase